MSKVIWSEAIVPGDEVTVKEYTSEYYGDKVYVEKTRALPIVERQVKLPDRRAFRSMSRNGVLLSAVCLQAREEIDKFLEKDPFSIGIYCAVENGPVDLESTKALIGSTRENFAAMYKKHRNPKLYFKQLPNLAAAHMGSFLGLNGPMHVYNNSSIGSLHALEQAEMDLMDRRVSAALVCSAFSFEIPIMLERIKRTSLGERILCEGAGAMLLTSGEREIDWKDFNYKGTSEYYGISHQIIIQAIKRRTLSGDRTGNI